MPTDMGITNRDQRRLLDGSPAMRLMVLAALVVFAHAPRVMAQRADESPPVNALAIKQQMVLDRLARLEDHMFRLREKLAASEPENAKRLGAALERAGALDVKARITALAEALQSLGALDRSIDEQEALLVDMETILNVLLDRDPNDARRREELRRLAKIKQDLDQLLQAQMQERRAAARQVQARRLARQIEAATRQLEQLEQEQTDLAKRTTDSDSADDATTRAQADEQAQLAERAERLERELKRLAQRNAELKTDPGGENAEHPEAGETSEPLDDAAAQLEDGAKDMREAAKRRAAGKQKTAHDKQEDALEKVRRAIHRLKEAQKQLESQSESSDGDNQRRIAERAGKLAQQMQRKQSGAQRGDSQKQQNPSQGQRSQEGQQPSGESPGQQPAPGQENVERARQHMQDAADELDEQDPKDAIQEQDKALDELERAKRELEETLKQLRKEEQEEILASLEARLTEMLAEQVAINHATQPLSALGVDNFTRVETLRCAELAERQGAVSEAAGTCVRLLEEDGTTVVFPNMMRRLAEDMRLIAQRLAQMKVNRLTTALQTDARRALAELLEALKKLREKSKEQQRRAGGGGGGAGGDAPLVPTSAELRLLKSSQVRVNRQTATAHEADTDEDAAELLTRAAGQQAELVDMAKEIRKRAEKGMGP